MIFAGQMTKLRSFCLNCKIRYSL